MLWIRPSQLAALDEAARRRFARKLAGMLVRRYRDLGEREPEALLEEVVHRCRTAARFGLTSETAVGDFVDLTYQLGPQFHEHPEIRKRLLDASVPDDRRMATLFEPGR
ncbi:MAG: hypothetical protein ACXW5U_25565 [Thermoanaerobaculia bacterium]